MPWIFVQSQPLQQYVNNFSATYPISTKFDVPKDDILDYIFWNFKHSSLIPSSVFKKTKLIMLWKIFCRALEFFINNSRSTLTYLPVISA